VKFSPKGSWPDPSGRKKKKRVAERRQSTDIVPGSRSARAPERRLPRGRHDLPREFVARTQRDRLIDAMARTVASKGFGVPLTEVCSAAGVSTRAFYEHFADKEACFMATFERGAILLQRSVAAAYRQPDRWPLRIRRGLEMLLHLLAAEPAFTFLAIVEMLAAGPRPRERCRQFVASFGQFFRDAPRRDGQPPTPVVAEAVVAGVFGLLFNYVSAGRTSELPGLLPEITYFVLVPFVGERSAMAAAGLSRRRRGRAG
jgi:AcrR family transcriptional regulator